MNELSARTLSLGLHVTDRCNARCLHCAYNCGPDVEGKMKLADATRYVKEAVALDVQLVCISGGEPMMYPRLVEAITSECGRLAVPEVWLFTNGFWANNAPVARETIENLKSQGLKKLLLSVDAFHQEYIPLESIRNAIEASIEVDLEVGIDARFVGDPDDKNEHNEATRSYLNSLGSLLSTIEITKAQPMYVGRAAESLAKLAVGRKPLSQIIHEKCPGVWAGGTLEAPQGVDVDEYGLVTVCPGFSIGNTLDIPLRKILEKYDYQDHVVISTLHDHGMEGLMTLASEKGFIPKEEAYVNGCHFCYEARKFLRRFYPNALAPSICYL